MENHYFNTFANMCNEKNWKIRSESEKFATEIDVDKFEQLRMEDSVRNGESSINSFNDYLINSIKFMDSVGFYLNPALSFAEIMEEYQRIENTRVSHNEHDDECESVDDTTSFPDGDELLTTPTCLGCIEDQPNQLAHMGFGGCLNMGDEYEFSEDDLSEITRQLDFDEDDNSELSEIVQRLDFDEEDDSDDEEVTAPDRLVLSTNSMRIIHEYAGNYTKTDLIVRGAPVYVKTRINGLKFFLFRGIAGHWLFGDNEEDLVNSTAAISSTTKTAEFPHEVQSWCRGIEEPFENDNGDEEGWIEDTAIVLLSG